MAPTYPAGGASHSPRGVTAVNFRPMHARSRTPDARLWQDASPPWASAPLKVLNWPGERDLPASAMEALGELARLLASLAPLHVRCAPESVADLSLLCGSGVEIAPKPRRRLSPRAAGARLAAQADGAGHWLINSLAGGRLIAGAPATGSAIIDIATAIGEPDRPDWLGAPVTRLRALCGRVWWRLPGLPARAARIGRRPCAWRARSRPATVPVMSGWGSSPCLPLGSAPARRPAMPIWSF